MKTIAALLAFFLMGESSGVAFAEVNWQEGAVVSPEARANPYGHSPEENKALNSAGRLHAQIYPVGVTGMLPPFEPLRRMLETDDGNPLKTIFRKMFGGISGFREVNDILAWVGLHEYPALSDTGIYAVPYPDGKRPKLRMGFGLIDHPSGQGFTLSCATCHSGNLFGKTVLGLNNRFPRANEVFGYAKKTFPLISPWFFQLNSKASDGERDLFSSTRRNLRRVATKMPVALGLDTSLAQVALSLAHRNLDAYATRSQELERRPRPEPLRTEIADSKPAVWWNLKYKNRWLADGSVVAGNPIFTNILWNEIGRGADLAVLETWLRDNGKVIEELTTAAFSSEAPRYTDFFPAEEFPLAEAKAGQHIYEATCARCHGTYTKAWDEPGAENLSAAERLATLKVIYRAQTPVIDVGTDPGRWRGMKSLEQLNDLAISRNNGILIKAQKGYVPPPLVGIWARWPYLHNNSVPSLCALLERSSARPRVFFTGAALDQAKDFDAECNGYPLGSRTPAAWKNRGEHRIDTGRVGLSNAGHDEGIFLKQGADVLSPADKRALIRFLQTL
ncbi:MAG: cytochrome c [Proteobacteria bacterium]|nr:MAG: cytochrome c [Pseudomonadota bacterium]